MIHGDTLLPRATWRTRGWRTSRLRRLDKALDRLETSVSQLQENVDDLSRSVEQLHGDTARVA